MCRGGGTRKTAKHDRLFPVSEAAVLETPLLSAHQQYLSFCEAHPADTLSEETFRKYANEIDGLKITKRVQQMVKARTNTLDLSQYLAEVLECERGSGTKQQEMVEGFPEVQEASSPGAVTEVDLSCPVVHKRLLVVLLFACNVSQERLARLMGVSKSSIHYWISGLCTGEFEWQMLGEIACWSGKVSFDEKWVRIKGRWYFVLCAVDSISGFPLLIGL